MSNYTLTPSIDVYSSGSNGKINLYDSSTINAVQIATPTLSGNVDFNLPTTSGSTGQFLSFSSGAPSSWISSPSTNHTSLPITLNFITGIPITGTATYGASVTSATPTSVGKIYFLGTAIEGTPSAIYSTTSLRLFTGDTYTISVVDITNSVTIATLTNSSGIAVRILNIPITGSISPSPAIWDVQISVQPINTLYIHCLQVLP